MVRIDTLYGLIGDFPRKHKIHRSTKTVQIGPRSLLSFCAVLFFGRKASLDRNRYRIFRQFHISCRPKINQFQLSIFIKHQIINADITVNQSRFVNITQGMNHRFHQRKHLLAWHFSIFPDIITHPCAFDIFHHNVRRTVFLKEIAHRDDTRQFHKTRQTSRLFQKIFFSLFKLQFTFSFVNLKRPCLRPLFFSCGNPTRKIFFYCDRNHQHNVPRHISNPKSPFSQHFSKKITFIQAGAKRKRHIWLFVRRGIKLAFRTMPLFIQ